eukprot:CAMPEP_0202698458 /NCGR_PEP_ID=MMETSP1385-20130828/11733_1 /ASSEMBLY_ACC=CAM_ASM_000861 /TAXON_ID=933848 /ORGANISM="Elphidium margaritaceum" /LENGTH=1300 /DNA_ID=CAMNT_0049355181 /DNA_START=47 /DNA_END=3949 /DNA_ORIENTATION=+
MSPNSLWFSAFVLVHIVHGQITKDDYYANWMDYTGLSDSTTLSLLDVVLPGSHHSGMYPAAIQSNGYSASTDAYWIDVLQWITGTSSNVAVAPGASRQIGSVLQQLNAGARFLDIRLEKKNSNSVIYAHHGLLGATIDSILSDIVSFLQTSNGKEIIVLHLNNFVNMAAADVDAVFDLIATTLSDYVALESSYALSDAMATVLAAGSNVIPIYDQATTHLHVKSAASTLTGTATESASSSDVIASVLDQLRNSWDVTKANVVYYALSIGTVSDYTSFKRHYANYVEYNAELALTLPNTIRNYPKLYFGNMLVVDFVQASTVVDEAVLLNANYAACRDTNSAAVCAASTNLARDYKSDGISADCVGDSQLLSDCARACGVCEWLAGAPGDACNGATVVCDNAVYATAMGAIGSNGVCYLPEDEQQAFIGTLPFCLAPFAHAECGTISSNTCSANGTVEDVSDDDCDGFCSVNYQCVSGYCNSATGKCLSIATPAPTTTDAAEKECYCDQVTSDGAIEFRASIDGLRPGDPDGEYELANPSQCSSVSTCNEVLDESPYVKSLIGFILIPFAFSIVMFIVFGVCCCNWCCCPRCAKKRCCRCCVGDPNASPTRKWLPVAIMAAVLITILWACIQGAVHNSKMHDHIFAADAEDGSVRTEINELFDTIVRKFEGIPTEADWIVAHVDGIMDDVSNIIGTQNGSIEAEIDNIYGALNYIVSNYDNYSLNATVSAPFNGETRTVQLPCEYCTGLGAQIGGINDTLRSVTGVVGDLQSLLNDSTALVDARDTIDTLVDEFRVTVQDFIDTIESYRNDSNAYMADFEGYDERRESAGFAFFILPCVMILFWVIGVVLAVCEKIPKCGECFFRCTWFPMMWIGASVMLVFAFFAVISVGWADLCVNLDEFERDPLGSTIGQAFSSFGDETNATASGSPTMAPSPAPAGTGSGTGGGGFGSVDVVQIVNACWAGSDLLELFNLTDTLNWDSYRENLTDLLQVDVTRELSVEALDEMTTEINLLSTDEFEVTGDELIAALNAVGGTCLCDCAASNTSSEPGIFTRDKLRGDLCHNTTGQGRPWTCQLLAGTDCIEKFVSAYSYVSAEQQFVNETQAVIDDIKSQTRVIIQAYDGLYGIAVGIENSVQSIACKIDPIFERFDRIISDYSNCGFVGEIYGGFKYVGCVLLFDDMYWISAAMMVIAFVSILVVSCGFMTQYVFYPPSDEDDDEDDIGVKIGRSVSSRVLKLGGTGDDEQSAANEMEMADTTKQEGATTEQQPPPPTDAPPDDDVVASAPTDVTVDDGPIGGDVV